MTFTGVPPAIHTAFNPVLFEAQGVRGESKRGWIVPKYSDGTWGYSPDGDFTINFYADTVRFDISTHLKGLFRGDEKSFKYELYLGSFTSNDSAGERVCTRSVAQVGEPTDLEPYVGRVLTGFEQLTSWEGFDRDVWVLGLEGIERKPGGCLADLECEGEFTDFVELLPGVRTKVLGANANTGLSFLIKV